MKTNEVNGSNLSSPRLTRNAIKMKPELGIFEELIFHFCARLLTRLVASFNANFSACNFLVISQKIFSLIKLQLQFRSSVLENVKARKVAKTFSLQLLLSLCPQFASYLLCFVFVVQLWFSTKNIFSDKHFVQLLGNFPQSFPSPPSSIVLSAETRMKWRKRYFNYELCEAVLRLKLKIFE